MFSRTPKHQINHPKSLYVPGHSIQLYVYTAVLNHNRIISRHFNIKGSNLTEKPNKHPLSKQGVAAQGGCHLYKVKREKTTTSKQKSFYHTIHGH